MFRVRSDAEAQKRLKRRKKRRREKAAKAGQQGVGEAAQQAQQDQDPSLRGSEVGSPCEPAPQATAFPFVVQDYAPREDSIAGGASVLLAGRQRRT